MSQPASPPLLDPQPVRLVPESTGGGSAAGGVVVGSGLAFELLFVDCEKFSTDRNRQLADASGPTPFLHRSLGYLCDYYVLVAGGPGMVFQILLTSLPGAGGFTVANSIIIPQAVPIMGSFRVMSRFVWLKVVNTSGGNLTLTEGWSTVRNM